MPSRRSFVALAASASLLGGCGRIAGDGETPRPTPLPWGEQATVGGTTITTDDAWVQHSSLALASADQEDVVDFGDRQFLFASVSAATPGAPNADEFSVVAGDGVTPEWSRVNDGVLYPLQPDGAGTRYDAERPTGWLAFSFPDSVSGLERATLSVGTGGSTEALARWQLPGSAIASLEAPPPAFTTTGFDAPETVARDEPFDVTVTVTNDGGSGVYRAAVNETGPMYAPHSIRLPVESGGTASTSVTIDTHLEYDRDHVRFRFVSADDELERAVRVTEG